MANVSLQVFYLNTRIPVVRLHLPAAACSRATGGTAGLAAYSVSLENCFTCQASWRGVAAKDLIGDSARTTVAPRAQAIADDDLVVRTATTGALQSGAVRFSRRCAASRRRNGHGSKV